MPSPKNWKEVVKLVRPLYTNGAYNTDKTKTEIHKNIDFNYKKILTKRDRDVLHLLLSSQNKETGQLNIGNDRIAESLDVSISTAKRSLYQVFKKFPTSIIPILYFKNFTSRRQILIDWDIVCDIIVGKVPQNYPKTMVFTNDIEKLREVQKYQKSRRNKPSELAKSTHRNNCKLTGRMVPCEPSIEGQNEPRISSLLEYLKEPLGGKTQILTYKIDNMDKYNILSTRKKDNMDSTIEFENNKSDKVTIEDVFDIFIADNLSIIPDNNYDKLLYDQEEFYMEGKKDRMYKIISCTIDQPEESVHTPKNFRLPDGRAAQKAFDEITSLPYNQQTSGRILPKVALRNLPEEKVRPLRKYTISQPGVLEILKREKITIGELNRRLSLNPEYNPLDNPGQKFYDNCHPQYSHIRGKERDGLFVRVAKIFFGLRSWRPKEKACLKRARKMADKAKAEYYDWISAQSYEWGKDFSVWKLEGERAEEIYSKIKKEAIFIPPPHNAPLPEEAESGEKSVSLALYGPTPQQGILKRERYFGKILEKAANSHGFYVNEEGKVVGGDTTGKS